MSKYTKAVEKEKINQLVSSDAFILGSGNERSEMIETLFEQFETPIANQLPKEDAIRLMAKEWASCFEPPERLGMESANLAGLLRMAWIASDVISKMEEEKVKDAVEFMKWVDANCFKENLVDLWFTTSKLSETGKTIEELYQLYQSEKAKK